ncbi:hypothetical protein BsWGS_07252 [Bradybaena similaris]
MKLACAIFLCAVAAVHGWTPGPEPNCTEKSDSGGNDYKSHNKHCGLYYRCDHGVRTDPMACAPGTLYHEKDIVCRGLDDPELICANWPCVSTKPNARYPHPCKTLYYECGADLKGYTLKNCSADQHFDMALETCVSGVEADEPSCMRNKYNASYVCNLAPDSFGDPCKYITKDGNRSTTMDCAEKTSFNQSTCGCTTNEETRCTKTSMKNNNKMPDNLCRSTFSLTFDLFSNETGSPPLARSIKTMQELKDYVQVTGVTFAGGVATFSSTATSPAQLYVFNFNNNEMTKYVLFVISFRITGTGTSPVQLITNNYNGVCTPTHYVTATLNGNTYTITAYARMMIKGNTTVIEDTVTINIQVATPNSYVEVIAVAENNLKVRATDKGTTGSTTGTVANGVGTVNFPSNSILAYNKCGYAIGSGLIGNMIKFAVHEGCRNTSMVMN